VVLVVGARLNWMFDFGSAQQFSADVKFIKVDVSIIYAIGNIKGEQIGEREGRGSEREAKENQAGENDLDTI
jgi:hypothetical protein